MRELFDAIAKWRNRDTDFALATVVSTWGSAPRPLGSTMAVSSRGEIIGSVSGGCVEAAVADAAGTSLATGRPELLHFGVEDEVAWQVGLSCGGKIEVFVEPYRRADLDRDLRWKNLNVLIAHLEADRIAAVATVLAGDDLGRQIVVGDDIQRSGSLGSDSLDRQAVSMTQRQIANLASRRAILTAEDTSYDVFVHVHPPRPQLIIVGAVHVAIHLVALASRLGFATIVIDPRTAFATPERFAEADRLITRWPSEALPELIIHQTTCLVFLSHDPKIDLPGLEIALESPALYVGALGSKKTHAKRVAALTDSGFSTAQIGRIHAPIGLDLGGRRAEEIALAIMAEILAVRYGRARA